MKKYFLLLCSFSFFILINAVSVNKVVFNREIAPPNYFLSRNFVVLDQKIIDFDLSYQKCAKSTFKILDKKLNLLSTYDLIDSLQVYNFTTYIHSDSTLSVFLEYNKDSYWQVIKNDGTKKWKNPVKLNNISFRKYVKEKTYLVDENSLVQFSSFENDPNQFADYTKLSLYTVNDSGLTKSKEYTFNLDTNTKKYDTYITLHKIIKANNSLILYFWAGYNMYLGCVSLENDKVMIKNVTKNIGSKYLFHYSCYSSQFNDETNNFNDLIILDNKIVLAFPDVSFNYKIQSFDMNLNLLKSIDIPAQNDSEFTGKIYFTKKDNFQAYLSSVSLKNDTASLFNEEIDGNLILKNKMLVFENNGIINNINLHQMPDNSIVFEIDTEYNKQLQKLNPQRKLLFSESNFNFNRDIKIIAIASDTLTLFEFSPINIPQDVMIAPKLFYIDNNGHKYFKKKYVNDIATLENYTIISRDYMKNQEIVEVESGYLCFWIVRINSFYTLSYIFINKNYQASKPVVLFKSTSKEIDFLINKNNDGSVLLLYAIRMSKDINALTFTKNGEKQNSSDKLLNNFPLFDAYGAFSQNSKNGFDIFYVSGSELLIRSFKKYDLNNYTQKTSVLPDGYFAKDIVNKILMLRKKEDLGVSNKRYMMNYHTVINEDGSISDFLYPSNYYPSDYIKTNNGVLFLEKTSFVDITFVDYVNNQIKKISTNQKSYTVNAFASDKEIIIFSVKAKNSSENNFNANNNPYELVLNKYFIENNTLKNEEKSLGFLDNQEISVEMVNGHFFKINEDTPSLKIEEINDPLLYKNNQKFKYLKLIYHQKSDSEFENETLYFPKSYDSVDLYFIK